MTETPITARKIPILSIVAGATLLLSLFTPRFLLTLPVMATVGLAIVGAVRKETPRWLPYVIGVSAVVLVLGGNGSFNSISSPTPVLASAIYKDAAWDYGSAKDDMRGTVSKWATLYSPTDLNFLPPYDGSNSAHIQVDSSDSIILQVEKGQLICEGQKQISVKFDNGPVWKYPCESGVNGDSTTIYIEKTYEPSPGQPDTVIDGIERSKTMMVEVQAYDNGYPQITFNVGDLNKRKLK